MTAPTDRNARIALAKGWTWIRLGSAENIGMWHNPQGELQQCPDYLGTLAGVDELMRELQDRETRTSYNWMIRWSTFLQIWEVWKEDEYTHERFAQFLSTKEEGFGVAVGDAWLSVKEVADE